MKFIITESQFKKVNNLIHEQKLLSFINLPNIASKLTTLGTKPYELYKKWEDFSNNVRPRIEKVAKELYNADSIKDKTNVEYKKIKDKEDAFCHQLASAISTNTFGAGISDIIGKLNELKGGMRIFFKGNKGRNISPYSTFSSGYTEDIANNNLGIEIGKKFPNNSFEFYQKKVSENINSGNYFDSSGKKVK